MYDRMRGLQAHSPARRNSLEVGMSHSAKDADGQPVKASPFAHKKKLPTPRGLLGMSGGPRRVVRPGMTPAGSIRPIQPTSAARPLPIQIPADPELSPVSPSEAVHSIAATIASEIAAADRAVSAPGASPRPTAPGVSGLGGGSLRQAIAFDEFPEADDAAAEQPPASPAAAAPVAAAAAASPPRAAPKTPSSMMKSGARRVVRQVDADADVPASQPLFAADEEDEDAELEALGLPATPSGCVVRLEAVRATGAIARMLGGESGPRGMMSLTPVRPRSRLTSRLGDFDLGRRALFQ